MNYPLHTSLPKYAKLSFSMQKFCGKLYPIAFIFYILSYIFNFQMPYKLFSRIFLKKFADFENETLYQFLWGRKSNKPFCLIFFINNFYWQVNFGNCQLNTPDIL